MRSCKHSGPMCSVLMALLVSGGCSGEAVSHDQATAGEEADRGSGLDNSSADAATDDRAASNVRATPALTAPMALPIRPNSKPRRR